jgi:hypothetical protein
MYNNRRDAEFRLLGTVVFYKDKYCTVTSVGEDGEGKITLELNNTKNVAITNKHLKLRSIPTGYTMIDGEVYFLQRKPVRKYRQGLRNDNCSILLGSRPHFFHHASREYKVGENKHWVVYSSNFAALNNVLYYRNRLVGFVKDGDVNQVCLVNGMSFLKESVKDEVK